MAALQYSVAQRLKRCAPIGVVVPIKPHDEVLIFQEVAEGNDELIAVFSAVREEDVVRTIREESNLPQHARGLTGRWGQFGNPKGPCLFTGNRTNQLLAFVGRMDRDAVFDLHEPLGSKLFAGSHQFPQRDTETSLLKVSPQALISQPVPGPAVRHDASERRQNLTINVRKAGNIGVEFLSGGHIFAY